MRWSYIVPRILIVLLLWGFLTWGLDPLLKYSSVQTLQSITGARADVAEFSTQLFPPQLNISGVALASAAKPGTNLLEFEQLTFGLVGDPLLRKQFVVREGRLTGVRFNTRRDDDGQLELPEAQPEDDEPSWMADKLSELSDEWLNRLTADVKQQLDPNTLATYRTGTEIYNKWDERFESLGDRGRLLKPRFEQMKSQFENARRVQPVERIEQYLQVAQRADSLTQEAQLLKSELSGIVPEVKADFARLDQARRSDQEMIQAKLEMLKPDPRRISESLIGEQMYLQLQQLLSWVELAREYQDQLKEQTRPTRSHGRNFDYPVQNPAPAFLLEKLFVSGSFQMDGETVPFEAVISDVTSDAPLVGRPCLISLKTDGQTPLTLNISYDATQPVAETSLAAAWSDPEGRALKVGKPDEALLTARLSNIGWDLKLKLKEDQLAGVVQLQSSLIEPVFTANPSVRQEFIQAASDALSTIHSFDAQLEIAGTVRKPEIELHSDLGAQIGQGVQQAFANQLQNAKARLMAEVNTFASDQMTKMSARFASEYDQLTKENAELIAQVQEVQSLVTALQGGRIDPNAVFRQVGDSKLLNGKQQESVSKAMQEAEKVMNINKVLGQGRIPNGLPGNAPADGAASGNPTRPAGAPPASILPGRLRAFGGSRN